MRPTEFRKCLEEEFGLEFVCEVRGEKKKKTFKGRPIVVFRKPESDANAAQIKEENTSVKMECDASVKLVNETQCSSNSSHKEESLLSKQNSYLKSPNTSIKTEKNAKSAIGIKKEDAHTKSSPSSSSKRTLASNNAQSVHSNDGFSEDSTCGQSGEENATHRMRSEKKTLVKVSRVNGSLSHRKEKKRKSKKSSSSPKVNGTNTGRAKKSSKVDGVNGSKMPKLELG